MKKFHLIDVIGIAIFFAILLIAAIFFLRKQKTVDIVLRVSESSSLDIWYKPPLWYLENITPGLGETDWLGRRTSYIKDVETFYTNQTNRLFYITLSLPVAYNDRTNQYSHNGVPLLIGSYQTFKIQGIQVSGIVQKIGQDTQEQKQKEFLVSGYLDPITTDPTSLEANTISDGIQKYLSAPFRVGLTMRSNKGEVLAEILEVRKVPATRQFTYQNTLVKVEDVDKERVELKLKLKGQQIANLYFFLNEQPLVINAVLPLDFDTFGANLRVTDIVLTN